LPSTYATYATYAAADDDADADADDGEETIDAATTPKQRFMEFSIFLRPRKNMGVQKK
jgi:hypothetical protein